MRALVLVAALAACTAAPVSQDQAPIDTAEGVSDSAPSPLDRMPSWEEARAAGVEFRAVGQEPGWMVDIYRRHRIVLLLDYGETQLELPRPAPTSPGEGVTRYETQGGGHSAAITIRHTPCADAMSGQPYPSSVEVVVDGRSLRGCGRSV